MAQTYLLFDFGADEARVQQARHKLDGWRQAFRLDKKLQFKLDRGETSSEAAPNTNAGAGAEAAATDSAKDKKSRPKTKSKSPESHAKAAKPEASNNREVKLFVRLYFSPHEKLSEQRWIDRIPSEEPFKGASPKVVRESAAEFPEVLSKFDSLD